MGLVVAAGCHSSRGESLKSPPPASVANAPKEADLATVTLTEKAEGRLGVRVEPTARRTVRRTRTLGGEVVVPNGRSITVAAPVAGTVVPGGRLPAAGTVVRRGQVIVRIVALPPAGDLSAAQIRLDAAQKRAERSDKLLKAGAGTERALEDARAEVALAEAALAAARPHFGGRTGGGALALEAPQDGVLHDVYVGPGQSVAPGALLFRVDDVDPIWVRVPVYVGDLASVDRAAPVRVHGLVAGAVDTGREARPVSAPPSANAEAATSDLFFELPNKDGALRPGQKVSVSLPQRGEEEALVVPWSAVLHDIHGGAWVYEQVKPHVFARRRVEVRYVSGDLAVLARGPSAGAAVVAVGAAEIYGTEFGAGK